MNQVTLLVLILLSSIAFSEACPLFEGLARARIQYLLTLYPNLAEEIRSGQYTPNNNNNRLNNGLNNQNRFQNPNNNQGSNFGGQGGNTIPRNQGGLSNTLPNVTPNNLNLNGQGGGGAQGNIPNVSPINNNAIPTTLTK